MAKSKTSTPLRVTDVMTLVAATALGLGLVRAVSPPDLLYPYLPSRAPGGPVDWREVAVFSRPWLDWAVTTLQLRFIYFSPLVAAWTLAVLVQSLRRPRRAWPRLLRQPGVVAGLAACPAFALAVVRWLIAAGAKDLRDQTTAMLATTTGLAVVGAWTVLAAGGRWRFERSALGVAGLLLGLLWVATGPLVIILRIAASW